MSLCGTKRVNKIALKEGHINIDHTHRFLHVQRSSTLGIYFLLSIILLPGLFPQTEVINWRESSESKPLFPRLIGYKLSSAG